MCGKIMTVLLIFVLIVLNCPMARYNGRLHCIVGSYPPATSAKQPPISTPREARGPSGLEISKKVQFLKREILKKTTTTTKKKLLSI